METITLAVTGMNCDHCVDHVTSAIRAVEGVNAVVVSLQRKSALVRHTGTDPGKILRAVESAGYGASVIG